MSAADLARLQAARDGARAKLEAAKPGTIEYQVMRVAYREALLALTLALMALWGG